MSKALDLSKLLGKLSMKGSGASWNRGGVSGVNRLQGIWGWLWFSSGVAHRRGGVGSPFFGAVLLMLAGFLFWRGDWALGCHSMLLRCFPDVS